MMRGMFAAISGLKTHQVMLDVTSNDIANVNTIGYKSARTTFADSLTQTQRGASGPGGGVGGSNAAQVGLGVQLGSIDNLMTGGTMQSTGNATDVAIQGPGFFRVAASPTTPPTANPAAVEYTRAGNFTTSQDRLPDDPGRLLRPGPHRRRRRLADPAPGGGDEHADRPQRRGQLHGRRQHPAVRGLPVAGDVRQPRGPDPRGQPLAASANSGTPTVGTPSTTRASPPAATSRCPTWTSPSRSRT